MEAIKVVYTDQETGNLRYVISDSVHIKVVNDEMRITGKQVITGESFDVKFDGAWLEQTYLRIGGDY